MGPSKPKEPQRIAKLLSRAGIASRREIERMIDERRIALDGKPLETAATVLTSLRGVTVDGQAVKAPAPARLFRFHKPSGVLTTERDPRGRATIYDRLPRDLPRVMPVGRLDLNTEGLLLLTTDGELKRQLELPKSGVERSYRARAYGQVSQAQLEDLMLGVEIDGVRYGSINANLERRTGANMWIELTLTEGKNREVRRVLEHLGLQVSRLIRTRYGPFLLDGLGIGAVDEIRQHDVVAFRKDMSAMAPVRVTIPVAAAAERRPRPERRGDPDSPPKTRSHVRPAGEAKPRPKPAEEAKPRRVKAAPAERTARESPAPVPERAPRPAKKPAGWAKKKAKPGPPRRKRDPGGTTKKAR